MASCTLLACCWHLISCSVQVRESISKDLTSHPIQSGAVAAHGTVSQSLNTAPSNSSTQVPPGLTTKLVGQNMTLFVGSCWGPMSPSAADLYFYIVAYCSKAVQICICWLRTRIDAHEHCPPPCPHTALLHLHPLHFADRQTPTQKGREGEREGGALAQF